jgi:deazaflavin-dependent oxidoreductase (nitroreductase family)
LLRVKSGFLLQGLNDGGIKHERLEHEGDQRIPPERWIVGGPFKGMKLLILHTTGAKTGKERVNPVATIKDNGHYVIIASKGGALDNPDWYYNLVVHPEVNIEVGTETLEALAEVTEGPKRSELYAKIAERYPGFKEYEQKTERVIPAIRLKPIS